MENIEEVLKSSDVPSDLMQFIIWADVLEGARAALVAQQVVWVDKRLIGRDGNAIKIPHATQLSASTKAENEQMTASDKTITATVITVDTKGYSAVSLTKELLEDYPSIDWIRLQFRNMGKAVQEQLDSAILDLLIDNAYDEYAVGTAGSLDYDDCIGAVGTMRDTDHSPAFLVVAPSKGTDLLKDTKFINAQSQYYKFSDILNGEIGSFAGLRVLETTQMDATRALMVISPYDANGPSAVVAIKRDMTVTTETEPDYDRSNWFTTMRYGMGIVRASGVLLITGC
jgi:N4-gp56 family major capsid protein